MSRVVDLRHACWAWAKREAALAAAGALPVLSTDEAAVEADPERVVVFEDVRRCLVVLRSPAVHAELLLELAAFAGLPAATSHVASAHPLATLRDATAVATRRDPSRRVANRRRTAE